ncbi:MAG: glycoside hydrolase family 3 N-terminal domain-containing protein [Cyclobacteriaceae bacterium]
MKRIFLYCAFFFLLCLKLQVNAQVSDPAFLSHLHSPWVDSVLNTLSPDERIAQLIAVAAYSNRGLDHRKQILKMIREQKVGGLIFFQGGPGRQVSQINEYQAASKVPLLISMDAEWGLGMRLDSTISYPFQMTLGAIRDNDLIYQMGKTVAQQLKRTGVHVNLAPVVDVNNNPDNPVINYRSFGENKHLVAEKGIAFMKGMQDQNILTTAKHFPGHGDTGTDSHYALPLINHSRERLDSLELFPFREMIQAGVGGIMVAHLNIPALDASGRPSTLSSAIITDLLKKELGFQGLIVTDAMNMRGVTGSNPAGVVDKDAILAGNEMLELTEDVPRAIEEIRKAIRQGLISQKEIDAKCRKMLAVKYWVGLNKFYPIPTASIARDLKTPSATLLSRKLMEAALTVLKNDRNIIPLRELDTLRIASLSIGASRLTAFQESLSLYAGVKHFNLAEQAGIAEIETLRSQLKSFNLIIGGVHDGGIRPLNRFNFFPDVQNFISELAHDGNLIVAIFKNPYVLDKLKDIGMAEGLIITYEDNINAEQLAAQLIFGGVSASGRMPVSAGTFSAGDGIGVQGGIRFGYSLPEDVGMDSEVLFGRVDSMVNQALDAKAIPGCQILIARDKKVVLNKAYGLHTYSDTIKVKTTDLYDLASITKISTSMAALMKLFDEGKFKLNATLGDHLPKFKRSNKADLTFREILTHQAGFIPFIPFHQKTFRKNGSYKWATVKKDSSGRFPIKLSDKMFLHRDYPDKIVRGIRKSPLRPEKKYVYSDFFFMLAPRVVESMIEGDFSSYLQENFYSPLGASTLVYNPLKKYPPDVIVPTENDFLFRHKPVHGTVHDENAAMMKGISGHAGLFANANDLAKLMQMYLDMGTYGGKRYIREETLREFSHTQFPENQNRRALGFDKPNLEYRGVYNNAAQGAGPNSFGHTGFTGTFAWMDPDTGLLYIFLSNRVTPTRENARWNQLNTRTQIQQVMYEAMEAESRTQKAERKRQKAER